MANYSCKTFSPTTYSLATVHSLQRDGRQTDYKLRVLISTNKYGRQKSWPRKQPSTRNSSASPKAKVHLSSKFRP